MMKLKIIFILFFANVSAFAQCSLFPTDSEKSSILKSTNYNTYYNFPFGNESFEYTSLASELPKEMEISSQIHHLRHNIIPNTPVLTTKSNMLEVCEGNSTTLTAVSDYPIEWYTSYPPEGEPVGKGATFVTPKLTQGYSVYYAISSNNGIKSIGSEMEVIMVYPLPFIDIIKSNEVICIGEKVNLKAFGARYYEWNTGESSQEIFIHPEQTSHYKVTGINTAGCKNSIEFMQEVQDCKLSEMNETKETLQHESKSPESVNNFLSTTFPNPNTGEFQVKINNFTADSRIELFNSYGELVFNTNVLGEFTNIHLTNALYGIYTLRILDDSKLLKQEKVIIQK